MEGIGFVPASPALAGASCLDSILGSPPAFCNLSDGIAFAEASIHSALLTTPIGSFESIFGVGAYTKIQELVGPSISENESLVDALGLNVVRVDNITGLETAAYGGADNTIYVDGNFIDNSATWQIAHVLVEEIGHAIDARINLVDSLGDEGEIFASLVMSKSLSDLSVSAFSEDDSGILLIDGSPVQVEFNASVTLFEHAAYSGRAKTFGIGNYSFIGSDFNDIATSIRIPAGSDLVVEFFEHANFQGRSTVVSHSQASIGADWSDPNWRTSYMNDSISSLRVRRQRSNEVILYQHSNFQGLAHSETLGSRRQVRFNDDYSSIDLPRGARIDLFEHPNFFGRNISYTADAANLGSLNDRVSSFQAYQATDTGTVRGIIADRFRFLRPSHVDIALNVFGIVTQSNSLRILQTALKPIVAGEKLFSAYSKHIGGDPVNAVIDIVSLFPKTSWVRPAFSLLSDGARQLRQIVGNGQVAVDILQRRNALIEDLLRQ